MSKFNQILINFCRDERGATSIEYGLIGALVGLGVIGGAQAIGDNLSAKFFEIGLDVRNAGTTPPLTDRMN